MTEKKDAWGSTIGFILASLGMAIGTGNVWRFPRMIATWGAGSFILAWIVALFVWSIPLLIAECAIAKSTRCAHIGGFRDYMGKKWAFLGGTCAIVLIFTAANYSMVVGWCIKYLVAAATGLCAKPISLDEANALWAAFKASPGQQILFQAIALILAGGTLYFGIQAGVERVCKVVIPGLFILCIALSLYLVFAFPADRIGAAYQTMFSIQPEYLGNAEMWLQAFTQSAWSTGAGWGLLYAYAVRVPETAHVGNNGISVAVGDQLGALVCATVVIPAIFAFAAAPETALADAIAGGNTGLTFVSLTSLFSNMPGGGYIFSFLFFLILVGAGVTSMFAMVEVPALNMEQMNLCDHKKAVLISTLLLFVIGLFSAFDGFYTNQDNTTGFGLLLAGLIYSLAILKKGPKWVLDNVINDEHSVKIYKVGGWWRILISIFPIVFVVLFGWWMIICAGPGMWAPFVPFSIGSMLYQWILWGVIAFIITKAFYHKLAKGPMTVDED